MKRISSASDRTAKLSGNRARYALMSALNSYSNTSCSAADAAPCIGRSAGSTNTAPARCSVATHPSKKALSGVLSAKKRRAIPRRAPRNPSGLMNRSYPLSNRVPTVTLAGSCESSPVIASSSRTASRTVRASGPAVSWLCDRGTMPPRLTSPTVGFRPTIPLMDAGLTIEPSVSVPMATAQRFAATATADPELDPEGVRSSA